MPRWRKSAAAAFAAGLLLLFCPTPLSAGLPQLGPPCDQFDPFGPARSARITLDASDFVDSAGDAMRSFVETGSIGRVDVAIVGSTPPGIVLSVSAVPEISRLSRLYGERLKGIAVAVVLGAGRRPARVVLELRQVCARHFRNTFLYY